MVNVKCHSCVKIMPMYMFGDAMQCELIKICRFCHAVKPLSMELSAVKQENDLLRDRVADLEAKMSQLSKNNNELTSVPDTSPISVVKGNAEFITVRNGIKPRVHAAVRPIQLNNTFSVLPGLKEDDEQDIVVVGSSLTRGLLTTFCGRNVAHRKRYCYPGARVQTIKDNINDFTAGASANTAYIVLVGSNDLTQNNVDRQKLLATYRSLLRDLKNKSNNIMFSSILPRFSDFYQFHNEAFNLNRELKWLCAEHKIGYINAWDSFYNVSSLSDMYAKDGIHLSELGSVRLGRIYNEAAKKFFLDARN
jgi:hypothetical protein